MGEKSRLSSIFSFGLCCVFNLISLPYCFLFDNQRDVRIYIFRRGATNNFCPLIILSHFETCVSIFTLRFMWSQVVNRTSLLFHFSRNSLEIYVDCIIWERMNTTVYDLDAAKFPLITISWDRNFNLFHNFSRINTRLFFRSKIPNIALRIAN